jgi:hypothetical protein
MLSFAATSAGAGPTRRRVPGRVHHQSKRQRPRSQSGRTGCDNSDSVRAIEARHFGEPCVQTWCETVCPSTRTIQERAGDSRDFSASGLNPQGAAGFPPLPSSSAVPIPVRFHAAPGTLPLVVLAYFIILLRTRRHSSWRTAHWRVVRPMVCAADFSLFGRPRALLLIVATAASSPRSVFTLVSRSEPSLADSMAQYLIDRIEAIDKQLERARWRHNVTGEQTESRSATFFSSSRGSSSNLAQGQRVVFGRQEFHLTSSDVPSDVPRSNHRSGRPLPLETSVRGVFAVGMCAQDRSSEWARASAKGPP